MMTLISSSHLNHVSRSLKAYQCTCPWQCPGHFFHTMYRPPNNSKANLIENSSSFVEGAALSCCENTVLGDLNLSLDKQDSCLQKFNDSLSQYNFTQITDSPTYIHSHILDVICVRVTFSQAVCLKVTGGGGGGGVCVTILPSYFRSIYLSKHPKNSGRLIHRKSQDKYY